MGSIEKNGFCPGDFIILESSVIKQMEELKNQGEIQERAYRLYLKLAQSFHRVIEADSVNLSEDGLKTQKIYLEGVGERVLFVERYRLPTTEEKKGIRLKNMFRGGLK